MEKKKKNSETDNGETIAPRITGRCMRIAYSDPDDSTDNGKVHAYCIPDDSMDNGKVHAYCIVTRMIARITGSCMHIAYCIVTRMIARKMNR